MCKCMYQNVNSQTSFRHYFYPETYYSDKTLDGKLLKYFNYIEDEIGEMLFPKFVHSTLDNQINKLFNFIYILIKVPNPDK